MFCALTNANAWCVGKQFIIGSIVTLSKHTKGLMSGLLISTNANFVLKRGEVLTRP